MDRTSSPRGAEHTAQRSADWPPRGRVLRFKEGYNPNSSSIGSAVPLYLWAATGAGALAVVLLNLRGLIGRLRRERGARSPTGAAAPPATVGRGADQELDDQ